MYWKGVASVPYPSNRDPPEGTPGVRLRQLIGEIGTKYDRRLPMSSEAQMLLRQARVEFEEWLPARYRAEGSGGKGRAAVTPRIAIFDTDETTTTRRGIYVA